MKKKCILFLNRGSVLYGAETRLLDILRNLNREEFYPVVMLPKPGPFSDILQQAGIETVFLDFDLGFRPKIVDVVKLNVAMFRLLRKYQVEILHFNMHFGISSLWPVVIWLGKRTVVHLRSHFWIYPFERFLIYRCARIVSISDYLRRDFLRFRRSDFLTFIRKDKLQVLYDGIDADCFKPGRVEAGLRAELKIKPEEKVVAVVGAIHPLKGQHVVVEAALDIIKRNPNVRIVFIGGAYLNNEVSITYQQKLAERIKELNLIDRVLIVGARQDIPQVMNEIDILLQPSEREALGTSMIEAMACGKPVIGTNVDGIPEVIGEDECGLLLEERTPKALAEAVNYLIEHPDEVCAKGVRGRDRVLRIFNVKERIKRLHEIYSEI